MPLHALYDPRRPHELVIDAKGRLVTTSYAEWCSLVDWLFEEPAATWVHPLTGHQFSTVH
jgi:hypothetical protein